MTIILRLHKPECDQGEGGVQVLWPATPRNASEYSEGAGLSRELHRLRPVFRAEAAGGGR